MIITDENYEPALVHAAVNAAVRAGWAAIPGDLAERLCNWTRQERPYKTQPYVALDALVDECLRTKVAPMRSSRRAALVGMLHYAQLKYEADAANFGVIAPGGEHRARMHDRRALNNGELSREEFDRRWGGINIEG